MMRSLLAAACLLPSLAVPNLAAEQWIEPKDNGQIAFNMPSGNVGCVFTPEGGTDVYLPADGGPELKCDRIEPHYVTVILSPAGITRLDDPDEVSCCSVEEILRYGNHVEFDGFICYSERTGILCESEDGANGFEMARRGVETW